MEPFVARALIYKLLNDDERKDLKELEKTIPYYLQGFEICRRYHLKTEPIPEAETDRLNKLLWIWNQKWYQKYEANPVEVYANDLDHWIAFAESA